MQKNFLNTTTLIKFKEKSLKVLNMIFYIGLFFMIAGFGINYVFAQENSELQQIKADENSEQGGLMQPDEANANILGDLARVGTYAVYCAAADLVGGACPPNRQPWAVSLMVEDLAANAVVLGICDKTFSKAVEDGSANPEKACGDPTTAVAYARPEGAQGYMRYPYGGAGMLASSFNYAEKEARPPTDLALFINDSTKNNILGVQPAYAQSAFEGDFKTFVLRGWKLSRNIALGLIGVIVGVSALMIMFRAQIAPRVSVSVYNVLPMIPIGLGLILLSYPIITLVFSLMWPLRSAAIGIGGTIVKESFLQGSSLGSAASLSIGPLVVLVLSLVIGGMAGLGLGTLFGTIMIVVLLIAIFWVLISIGITYIKVYISMMFNTIFAPLIILLSMLPGRSGMLINFGKRLIADLLTIPVIWLSIFVGLAIMAYAPGFQIGGLFSGSTWAVFIAYIMKYFVGIGIIWKARNARKSLEGMLGVTDIWGMAPPEKKR